MAAPGTKALQATRSALLHDVLELAVGVARHDGAVDLAAVPPTLRPVLRLSRLGPRALAAADHAGEDATFRARVADLLEPDELSPAERLWLERPDGWEAELDALVQAAAGDEGDTEARRRLAHERRARRAAEEARDRAAVAADRARAEADDLRRAAAEATARATAAEEERATAIRSLKQLEAAHARVHEDLRRLRAEVEAPADAPSPVAAPVGAERVELVRAVAVAAEASTALTAALAEVTALLDSADAPSPERPEPSPTPPTRPPSRARRRPVRFPGGIHDDSAEAADHLVRRPGAVMLVDGYNASMATWPDAPLVEQRQRLVAALAVLEAHVGVEITVIFDGVGASARMAARPAQRVRVQFTDEGVEADDVILDTVEAIPVERPVVVVSNDERVREGARMRGANVLSLLQLQAVLG